MKTLPDKGVIIRCVTTDQKVVGSTPAERTKRLAVKIATADLNRTQRQIYINPLSVSLHAFDPNATYLATPSRSRV